MTSTHTPPQGGNHGTSPPMEAGVRPGLATVPALEAVRPIALRAIAFRLGEPMPEAVIDVRPDASDDDAVILHVNSGGNSIACEEALLHAGYRVEPLPNLEKLYGVLLRVTRGGTPRTLATYGLPPDRFARPLPTPGFLGRTDWKPSGRHTVLSGADGAREPAAISVWIGNREAAGSELVELADRLNGGTS